MRIDSGRGSGEGNLDRLKSSNECQRGQFADGSPTGSDREGGTKDDSWASVWRNGWVVVSLQMENIREEDLG